MAFDEGRKATVIPLATARRQAHRMRRRAIWAGRVETVAGWAQLALRFTFVALRSFVRLVLLSLFVLLEPFVRVVLMSIAFGAFLVTIVFGVLAGDAGFPTWGMLAFSVGALWLYWLFLGLMGLLMRVT
jgi:hypothetical protein